MARCPACGGLTPTGCNCDVLDSDCFEITGTGSAADSYLIEPILDPDSDNLWSCSGDGLLAELPASISDPAAAQAYASTNLSVTNDTLTVVPLNVEAYDTGTMHDDVTNNSRITISDAGVYCVTFNCTWNKNITGDRLAFIRKNGTDVLALDSKRTGGADLFVGHSLIVQDEFVATDYLEGLVRQTSGAALLLLTESYSPPLAVARV